MKVLFLGPYPPPFGGVQTHIVGLREYLRRQGVDSHVINITRTRRPAADGVHYPESAAQVLSLLRRLDYDVVHVHAGGQLAFRILALLLTCGVVSRAAVAFTFHSGGYPGSPEGRRTSARSFPAFVLRRLDALIGVNQELVELFARWGVAPARRHLIPPFSIPSSGTVSDAAKLPAAVEAFFATHAPVLISVGLLEPEYDLPLQIRALARIRAEYPSAGLVMIGSGSREAELRALIADQPDAPHMLLAGDVDHRATLAAIARAACLLRTTHYDGDAISVREALHLGTPVVATATALRPAGVSLIPIGDVERLVDGVIAVLRSADTRAEATSSANADCGEENLAAVLRLYRDLVERKR